MQMCATCVLTFLADNVWKSLISYQYFLKCWIWSGAKVGNPRGGTILEDIQKIPTKRQSNSWTCNFCEWVKDHRFDFGSAKLLQTHSVSCTRACEHGWQVAILQGSSMGICFLFTAETDLLVVFVDNRRICVTTRQIPVHDYYAAWIIEPLGNRSAAVCIHLEVSTAVDVFNQSTPIRRQWVPHFPMHACMKSLPVCQMTVMLDIEPNYSAARQNYSAVCIGTRLVSNACIPICPDVCIKLRTAAQFRNDTVHQLAVQ